MMTSNLLIATPFVFIIGALLTACLRGRLLKAVALAVPVVSFLILYSAPDGTYGTISFIGLDLVLSEVDRLSRAFGYVFHLIALLGLVFSLHHDDPAHYVVGLLYAGAAQGVTFAGDFFTLFLFWETLTVSATFLIIARRTTGARRAALRYLMVHAAGGLCLLAGIVLHYNATGSIAFKSLELGNPGAIFIFLGFGLNCAWPILHAWVVDSYPQATIAGTVFLSAFTTKSAVYVLARAFPGSDPLIWIGAAMVVFPLFFAVIENDLRRVLSYSLINQVGYMVVGIGIGTELAINGAVCHAYAHILYKGLLFMAMGAVIYRTGKINATELGGLYRTMPLTAIFCMIGAAAISAFPLFSGFIAKSMIVEAAAGGHYQAIWLILIFASAGVVYAIKVPYFAFFSHDSGMRPREAPAHMLLAMGGAAFMCIFIGVYPDFVYGMLPFPVDYEPYTFAHVLAQSQILFFTALAFTLLLLSGIYPREIRCVNIDADWFYRKGSRIFYATTDAFFSTLNNWADRIFSHRIPDKAGETVAASCEDPERHGAIPIGIGVLLAVLFLAVMSFLFFLI
ncbi:MAG: Na(+)/H(+) antiporter subunit D [Desulfuromonadales bacterium]